MLSARMRAAQAKILEVDMNRQWITRETEQQKNSRLPCALAVACALLFAPGASNALAGDRDGGSRHEGGGYTGPGPALVTVEQAKGMRDDTRVALQGRIIRSLGGKEYVFQDSTGTITVEISQEKWQGRNIGPDDLVEIHGEVDKDRSDVEIDAERVITR
jgi:uncharacterized protein (TIGR00156 family)